MVSRRLKIIVLIKFQDKSDERFKGVVWTSLSGIPIQVEHAWDSWGGGMGKIEYLNIWEL